MKVYFQKLVDKVVSTCLAPSLRRQGFYNESLINKASRFAACEVIDGDYLEFGVYQGDSLAASYKALKAAFELRSSQLEEYDSETNKKRKEVWQRMRFFAFDSFQGLPKLEPDDLGSLDFKKGMYTCDIRTVRNNLVGAGVPAESLILVEGWFSDTCNARTASKYRINKASIVWIDGDLYSSTRDVLRFVQNLLQDGTILIFDDWFSYRGNPTMGEQRAFFEWIETSEVKTRFRFQEYTRESWKRMSFIVSAR